VRQWFYLSTCLLGSYCVPELVSDRKDRVDWKLNADSGSAFAVYFVWNKVINCSTKAM